MKMKGSHVEACPGGLTQETEQVGPVAGTYPCSYAVCLALSEEEHILASLLIQGQEIPLLTT